MLNSLVDNIVGANTFVFLHLCSVLMLQLPYIDNWIEHKSYIERAELVNCIHRC